MSIEELAAINAELDQLRDKIDDIMLRIGALMPTVAATRKRTAEEYRRRLQAAVTIDPRTQQRAK